MRLITASGAHHTAASSGQPLGDGALNGFWPMAVIVGAIVVRSEGAIPAARQLEIMNSYGVLNLAGVGSHASGELTNVRARCERSPPLDWNDACSRATRVGGRIVGHEVPRQLERDVARGVWAGGRGP